MASELWQRIYAARTHANFTQSEVAEAVGVTRVAIGHWEASDAYRRTVPSEKNLERFAEATGAPLDWLKSDDSDIHPGWAVLDEDMSKLDSYVVPVVDGCLKELVSGLKSDAELDAGSIAAYSPCIHQYSSVVIVHNKNLFGPRLFGFSLPDDALEPRLLKDDLILVDPDMRVEHHAIVAVAAADAPGGYSVRQVELKERDDGVCIRAHSTTDDFLTLKSETYPSTLTVSEIIEAEWQSDTGIRVLGKVVQARRNLI